MRVGNDLIYDKNYFFSGCIHWICYVHSWEVTFFCKWKSLKFLLYCFSSFQNPTFFYIFYMDIHFLTVPKLITRFDLFQSYVKINYIPGCDFNFVVNILNFWRVWDLWHLLFTQLVRSPDRGVFPWLKIFRATIHVSRPTTWEASVIVAL